MSVGFAASNLDPIVRLRKAYRLCRLATFYFEASRAEPNPTIKAELFARGIVELRGIQDEVETAGRELKQQIDAKIIT